MRRATVAPVVVQWLESGQGNGDIKQPLITGGAFPRQMGWLPSPSAIHCVGVNYYIVLAKSETRWQRLCGKPLAYSSLEQQLRVKRSRQCEEFLLSRYREEQPMGSVQNTGVRNVLRSFAKLLEERQALKHERT